MTADLGLGHSSEPVTDSKPGAWAQRCLSLCSLHKPGSIWKPLPLEGHTRPCLPEGCTPGLTRHLSSVCHAAYLSHRQGPKRRKASRSVDVRGVSAGVGPARCPWSLQGQHFCILLLTATLLFFPETWNHHKLRNSYQWRDS